MKKMTAQCGWIFMTALCAGVWVGQAEGATAQLRVTTVPAGATVICDGNLRDASPVTISNLTPGPHLVHAEMAGYVPGRTTVQLVEGEKAAVEINLEQEMGLVLIKSNPDGVDISVNGAHRGKTPLLLADLPRGSYRVKASSAGYQDREMELKVEGRTPQKLIMDLNSDSARLTINSTPAGAAVVVDGLSRGVTPCVIEREPAGEKKIALSLADYAPFQNTVTLRSGDDQKIEAVLIPMPASLSIVGAPAGAKVYLDDQLRGQVPLTLTTISPGSYSVRVEMSGYEPETRAIDLKNRDSRNEEFNLVRNVGMVEVVADQPETSIFVDGEDKGVVPVQGDKAVVDPLKIELPVGGHQVELRKKGYFTARKTVNIVKGTSVNIKEIMRRNFVEDTVVRLKSSEVVSGVASRKFPNGDIELETRPGIFRTVKAEEILSVEQITGTGR